MALSAPPYAQQNANHSASLFRQAVGSAFYQAHGTLGGNDFAVTAQSTPNMTVQVAAGQAWVQGTSTGTISGIYVGQQGSYFALSDAPTTVTIATANPTNPRIDLIYLRILDTAFGDASNSAIIGVVTGTPASSPSVPALPANALDLAHVRVNANVTSITNSNISFSGRDGGGNNLVTRAIAAGTVLMTTEAALPSASARNPQIGQLALAADTYTLYTYLGGGNWAALTPGWLGVNTVCQSVAQTGFGANTFVTITCDQTEVGSGDGTGVTIGANGTGYYLIDGVVSGTNFASSGSGYVFSSFLQYNGAIPAAGQGARMLTTGAGTGVQTAAPLGCRVMFLSAGDTVALNAVSSAAWDSYAPQTNTSSWLSVNRVVGNYQARP